MNEKILTKDEIELICKLTNSEYEVFLADEVEGVPECVLTQDEHPAQHQYRLNPAGQTIAYQAKQIHELREVLERIAYATDDNLIAAIAEQALNPRFGELQESNGVVDD